MIEKEQILYEELNCYEQILTLLNDLHNFTSPTIIDEKIQQLRLTMDKIKTITVWRHKESIKMSQPVINKITQIQKLIKQTHFLHSYQKNLCQKLVAILSPSDCAYNNKGNIQKGTIYGKNINRRG